MVSTICWTTDDLQLLQKYNFMSNPYNYPFLQKDSTMYLSTITKQDFTTQAPYYRDSSFQQRDIPGTSPKVLIPHHQHTSASNFNLSTFVEPIPDRSKHIKKVSNPLFIDDIEGARPKCTDFRSRRVVDPLCPKYLLPTASEVVMDPGRKFIRDAFAIQDINGPRSQTWMTRAKEVVKQPIEGSSPSKLTKNLQSVSRLEVKDINKDMIFESARRTDPLQPNYQWRDEDDRSLNKSYGKIVGSDVKRNHPLSVNRPNDMCLGIKDIEGSQASSFFARSHFIDKRRQFRNYMVTQDIEKAQVSTLKKGISTVRQTNPLMPKYQFPGHKQTK